MRRGWVAVAAASMVVLTACSSGGGGSSPAAATATGPASVSGDITVLTNRTDQISDGTLKKYADEFNRLYPNIKVKFEGITDYATVSGKVYGLANVGVATGLVCNKAVWAQAGITDWPTTPEQFAGTPSAGTGGSPRGSTCWPRGPVGGLHLPAHGGDDPRAGDRRPRLDRVPHSRRRVRPLPARPDRGRHPRHGGRTAA
ncbi:hypothetical protein [Streptomyces sp. CB01881]|uniref:hypothetical protein n=1 Tax=Streptomyces sp. CB01881 TaxID=2078691 RepID=UPI0019D5A762|nr:hypothetical protein [Streptomyces sp. CB01881]